MIKVDENDPVGELEPTFPYRDVAIKRGVDMKEFYDLEGEIGRGKFGTVYKCREKGTNLTLAAKFVGIARRQDRKNVEREVEIMKTLQHPRLIQLYDAFETDNVMCVVLELIEGGELFERVIDDDFILTERACTVFIRQICEGVAFIHSHNIIHLDLKPENILCLTKTGNRIKIIDFGLARKYEPDKKLQVLFGTPEFVAPEVVNFDRISCATDMWSVGVICYVLLSGLSPFMGETDVETMANVTIARYDFEDDSFDDISPEAKDFISKLLLKDKEARLTAVECLSHPWLRRQIPPPPPALDTTKDNLRTYVENSTPFIQNPLIYEKAYHNKPGLIGKIIENEQKIINSRSIPIIEKNEMPIIPPLNENNLDHIILNSDKSRFKMINHPCLNNVGNISNNLENQKLQATEIVDENNIKNNNLINKVPSNKGPQNQKIIENSGVTRDLNNSNVQNAIRVPSKGPATDINIKDQALHNRPMDTLSSFSSLNESPDKKDINFKVQTQPLNTFNENNFLKLQEKKEENKTVEDQKNKLPTEYSIYDKSITPHSPVTSEIFQSAQRTDKTLSDLTLMVTKDSKREPFNSSLQESKRPEESKLPIVPKPLTIPSIVIPSISTTNTSNASSDFTLISFKTDETFSTKTERAFSSNFIKTTEIKKITNERISTPQFGDSLFKEGAHSKENDPTVYKQHLRSTPPWFSELKNQDSRKLTTDRFDRRSSDFSCFLNSKEDTESLNLADEIRKLSARLLQMSGNQPVSQSQSTECYSTNSVPTRSRNDPITCFLENHGIPHPRPKFKFSNLNRDVPIGSPPPPSNLAYYLNMASNSDKKNSRSAPETPRSSPEKYSEAKNTSTSCSRDAGELSNVKGNSQHIFQGTSSSNATLEHVHTNKSNKLNVPV